MHELDKYIRSIPDFPEPGIIFRDITTVIQDPVGFKIAIDEMVKKLEGHDVDAIAGLESRGFIFGAAIAHRLGVGMVLIRKKGKLPCETIEQSYDLEYGQATVEIHKDAIKPGQKIVLVDDLMATGGTFGAGVKLIEALGGKVEMILTLIELAGLKGREKLAGYDVESVICYDGK